jgi:putative transposase
MAQVLEVCRSGYYDFLKKEPSKRTRENQRLLERIKESYKKSRGVYGSPRIHKDLKNDGEKCSRKRIAKIMQKEKIQAKMRKKWKVTTQPTKTEIRITPNHLDQNFVAEAPNAIWVSDITYISTQEGWLYVAIVMDLFSRKIVGLSMGNRLQTDLVTQALKQALSHRNIKSSLLHHSDRGSQYTSEEFKELTDRHGIKLSMSAKGRCYDNAVVESFFHTLKTEHTYLHNYRIREEAKNSIFEYIEVFYNRQRLHSSLGYLSPEDFENLNGSRMERVG